ncbi:MarR family transcriptional regulator [Chloroflexi bacterium TSY]|nr:MarR family transcriptional regulator [Chloroflexi bacterium TSY]
MEKPDLFDLSYCAFSNLRATTRAVSQLYDEYMKPTGLRTTQCMVLANIGVRGKSTVTELAEAMMMDQTSMTRALNILKKEGMIKSVADEEDQRRRLITLTAEGERTLAMALDLRAQAQAKMIDGLGPEGVSDAIEMLSKMTAVSQA